MQILAPEAGFGSIGMHMLGESLFGLSLFAADLIYSRIAHNVPTYRRFRLGILVIGWFLVNLISFFWFAYWQLVLLLTSIALAVVIFRELDQFWRIGLVGADREVKSGIDYVKSLSMCKNSIRFLGIGASKLTENQKQFREAIDRCHQTAPVRLLLSRQDAPELAKFARMAGRGEDSYQNKVSESLRFIASLQQHERKNIEVRFYRQFPAFRLMFIDESICLMSYYIMGIGDGSNIPQLHIVKTPGSKNTEALYFGFAAYFEKIWDDSQPWNPTEYL